MFKKLFFCGLIATSAVLLSQCNKKNISSESTPTTPKDSKDQLVVTFTYGSEKEKWIDAATKTFNSQNHKASDGRTIIIHQIPMGSGECIREVQEGTRQTHIVSPASEAFIKLGNAESQTKTNSDLVKKTNNLCLSPVVIAMWEPMAKALGHSERSIGWKEIHDIAQNPDGWAAYGKPQWGKFRFGHTHPDFSNSGLISLIAEVYAGADKQRGLTVEDVKDPKVGNYLEEIEQAVVHYGKSTGFFGRKMFESGPEYLSAAVLYENMVIESRQRNDLPFPVVAIYPKEGTFWSDHPAGIVNREWVDELHQEAAQVYLDFLLSEPQQKLVMNYGFRPADVMIPLSDAFNPSNGVDAEQPQTTLEVPPVPVISEIRQLWLDRKKQAHICLVMDVSGSMKGDKLFNAKTGAKKLIQTLSDNDSFSLIAFSDKPVWICKKENVGASRQQLLNEIDTLYAQGGTAMYDAISSGFDYFQSNPDNKRITAVVILSDGQDTSSHQPLANLIPQITSNNEGKNTRVFSIGYGTGADMEILKNISESTKAKAYKGNTKNIQSIFLEISTFF
ncbi:MAG: extracellular solute-binding protein [Akkermansiaceae bacterium]